LSDLNLPHLMKYRLWCNLDKLKFLNKHCHALWWSSSYIVGNAGLTHRSFTIFHNPIRIQKVRERVCFESRPYPPALNLKNLTFSIVCKQCWIV
jgi:hypothetical protein